MTKKVHVQTTINGEAVEFLCEPRQSLLECLRDELELTGTKEGCNDGNCGACSVLLDGRLVNACLVLGVEANGRQVMTIEGIAKPGEKGWQLDPIQRAFLEEAALQCGICTPGFIVAAKALLERNPDPTEEQIRFWLAGNLCRCTGYDKIVRAVMKAAAYKAGREPAQLNGERRNIVLSNTDYRVVGTRPIRHDGVDKVIGRAIYGADVSMPGLAHGKVLRSPHAHARIRSIDTSKAEAMPGVLAVVTAGDLPRPEDRVIGLGEGSVNLKYLSDNILASDKALYFGHAIAAVAATSPHIAEEALRLIEVDYEVLPAVLDPCEAMEPTAPLLHSDLRTVSLGKTSDEPSNVAKHLQYILGDVDKGFAEADVVVEREVRTTMVHQGYIEPQTATAMWNADGQIEIWCSTQGAFNVRDQVSKVLQVPVSRIRVTPTEIGGGFGGKIPIYLEPVAALLSRKCGRPVKLTMSRAEVLKATGPAPGASMRVKLGATRDGRITAGQAQLYFEAGAYPGSPVDGAITCIFACYDIPNGRVDGYDIVVNKPKTAAYRAPGSPQAGFAIETVIDEVCEQLGMDPLEFRIKNSAEEGTRRIDGVVYKRIGSKECLEAAKAHPHYQAPLGGRNRGRGVAHGFWFNAGMQSTATLNVNTDGTVSLVEGNTDIGGTRTSIAMQAAEVLGLRAEDVHPIVVGTGSTGYTAVTAGSRTTFATGWAAILAAEDVARQMKERAAIMWNVDPSTVSLEQGVFTTSTDPTKQLTFKEVAARLERTGGPITGTGTIVPKGHGPAFATHIVDVEVDPETGKVKILRYTAVQDCGKAIHPSYAEGQLQGGAAQGIGWALNEGYVYDEQGRLQNTSLLDYRMPTALDLPMIDTVIVEVANPGHPYGARGVGEVGITPPLGALANAIYRATGARLKELPMSPGRILEAMGVVAGGPAGAPTGSSPAPSHVGTKTERAERR